MSRMWHWNNFTLSLFHNFVVVPEITTRGITRHFPGLRGRSLFTSWGLGDFRVGHEKNQKGVKFIYESMGGGGAGSHI